MLGEIAGGRFELFRRGGGFTGGLLNMLDIAGDLIRSISGFLHIPADFRCCAGLLFDGGGDIGGLIVNQLNV